jgi:hypothetical protein
MYLGSRARPEPYRLSRQRGILSISQPCRPPRPVTGIALLLWEVPWLLIQSSKPDVPLYMSSSAGLLPDVTATSFQIPNAVACKVLPAFRR